MHTRITVDRFASPGSPRVAVHSRQPRPFGVSQVGPSGGDLEARQRNAERFGHHVLQLKSGKSKKKAKRDEERRTERAEAYQDRMRQRVVDREVGREAREKAEILGRDPLAEKRKQTETRRQDLRRELHAQIDNTQTKPGGGKRSKREARKAERARGYREKMELRILDKQMGREARELAQLSGKDPLEQDNEALVEELLAKPKLGRAEIAKRIGQHAEKRKGSLGTILDKRLQLPVTGPQKERAKKKALGLPKINPGLARNLANAAQSDESSYRVSGTGLALSVEGTKGKYDEDFGEGAVFWRGDTRPPKQVLKTGFTPKIERDLGTDHRKGGKRPNTMVYRTGDDDLVPASGVCVARDIRGACFFPFDAKERSEDPQEEHAYLYALALKKAVNTSRAQKDAERSETGAKKWTNPRRFAYDPQERHSEHASAVWPFEEYATHRVAPEQVLAAFRMSRQRLVAPDKTGDDIKAGMRFRIDPKDFLRRKKNRTDHPPRLREEARHQAEQFRENYPRHPDHYLSYQGTVGKVKKGNPQRTAEAESAVRQIDPISPPPRRIPTRKQKRLERLARKREEKQRNRNFRPHLNRR